MGGKQELQAVIQGTGNFTRQLYNILSRKDGNVFFSPISAHAVLAMCYQGADGSTKEAFTNALSVPDTSQTAEGYKDIMGYLNNLPDVQLLMANKIFVKKGYNLKSTFKKVVKKKFLSEVEAVNFADSRESATKINDWVESKTQNKIKDLISPDSLDSFTRLVLVNAIYFKGNWERKFRRSDTKTEKFYLNNNDFVDVEMMNTRRKCWYLEDKDLDAKFLELPYANSDLSLIIFLPNKRNGIGELEAKLATTDVTNITGRMIQEDVVIKLPKFRIETTIGLDEPLQELGLGVIFDPKNANFAGMHVEEEPLYVSKAIQKAFIEVNEKGTEAAAATALRMLCSFSYPVQFYADHGFLFLLTYKKQLILFNGRLIYPRY